MSIPPLSNARPYGPPPHDAPPISQEERTTAMLAYLVGIVTGFLGPLLFWLVKKRRSKFVAFHALQALLLHVIITTGYAVSLFLMYFLIGFVTGPWFFILGLVLSIVVGVAAFKGEWFEVPIIGPIARWLAGL